MQARRIVGIVLIVIGIVAFATGGFTFTRQKTVLDTGPLEIKTEKHERIPLPPVVGGICLVGGIVLVALPSRRRA